MSLEIPGIGSPHGGNDYLKIDKARQAPRVPRMTIDAKPTDPVEKSSRDAAFAKLIEQLFTTVAPYDKELRYSINQESGQVVVKVIDARTDKVIKEIPPEEIQKLQAKIKKAVGLLIDKMI